MYLMLNTSIEFATGTMGTKDDKALQVLITQDA